MYMYVDADYERPIFFVSSLVQQTVVYHDKRVYAAGEKRQGYVVFNRFVSDNRVINYVAMGLGVHRKLQVIFSTDLHVVTYNT